MRRRVHIYSTLLGLALITSVSGVNAAEKEHSSPPKSGLQLQGAARFVSPSQTSSAQKSLSVAPLPLEQLSQAPQAALGASKRKKGRRPRVPRANLPEGVSLSEPNAKARRSISEGPTSKELQGGAQDRELAALANAERVLFPKHTRGLSSSWSFDLPELSLGAEHSLGLPLSLGRAAAVSQVNREDLDWLRSLTLPDLPVRLDKRVVTYLKFYRDSHRGRTIAAIWTRKSGRYVAEIKAKLRRAGLPADLVWLSMIESGHNPVIRSPAGAMGLWQFMPASGRMYGLTVDRWVDERRDPARATQAAIRFLGDLHRRFGNWELAMGAYNMGYAGMSRAVAKYNTNDYWALSRLESGIPWETTLYVPKIFALAIVMNNREAFGVGRTQLDPAVSFDTILLEPATPLAKIALAASLPLSEFSALNPQYIASRLPPQEKGKLRKWSIRVPRGSGASVLAKLRKSSTSLSPLATHRVRLGDTVQRLALDYGVSQKRLQLENGLGKNVRLQTGTVLVLPRGALLQSKGAPVEVVVTRCLSPGEGQKVVYYQVRAKDDLDEIAHVFGVRVADLARHNSLNKRAHLRRGMTLQILVEKNKNLKNVRHISRKAARLLVAGSSEFHDYFEAKKGKTRVQIKVRKGDTLRKVGRRYGMSVGSMERVNRRSRKTALVIGENLIVYTAKKVSPVAMASGPGKLLPVQAPFPDALP